MTEEKKIVATASIGNTTQRNDVSLNEKTIRTFLKEPEQKGCSVEIKFDNYDDIGHTINSLICLCNTALRYSVFYDDNNREEIQMSIINSTDITKQLIPHSELELLSKIKNDFVKLNNIEK